jgi:hypothetical protein
MVSDFWTRQASQSAMGMQNNRNAPLLKACLNSLASEQAVRDG